MIAFSLRPLHSEDAAWVARHIAAEWGAEIVVAHGAVYRPAELPGLIAEIAGAPAGLLTYHIAGDACEIVTLDSARPGCGVGAALIAAVKEVARRAGCRRLWLITTNDNTHALRFYQKRGFVLAALHRNAVAASRALKPEIPLLGADGIPIRDEIELEFDIPAVIS